MMSALPLVFASSMVSDLHETGPGHPEQPKRIDAVLRGVEAAGFGEILPRPLDRVARRQELLRVHPSAHLNALNDFIVAGRRELDPDTPVSEGSWDASLRAAAAGLSAVRELGETGAPAAFVAVRPPGHHASANRAMGFCLLNNVAITAAALVAGGERVLIIDWDVHHGNGTQDIFWDDPRVLFVSLHEWPAFPGTGRASEVGGPTALGSTVNVPLPAGTTGDVARLALDEIVAPEVERFGPTWVLVSCGFDSHRDDPLGGMSWSAGDYADLTAAVTEYAPAPGRLVLFLEGGYDLAAIESSSAAVLAAMAGSRYRTEPPTSGGPGRHEVAAALRFRERALEVDRWA